MSRLGGRPVQQAGSRLDCNRRRDYLPGTQRGRDRGDPIATAPKEQPPRKLSGKRTAWPSSLESSGHPVPLTEGGKSGISPGKISQVGRQRGQGSAEAAGP